MAFSGASPKFIEEFEKRSSDTVSLVLMARAYGSMAAIHAAGLEIQPGKKDIWGLLIFGKSALHFFVHPSENYMGFLIRSFAGARAPQEQWVLFPKESVLSIAAPRKRGFSSFLSKTSTIELSFANAQNPLLLKEEVESTTSSAPYTLYFETIETAKEKLLEQALREF